MTFEEWHKSLTGFHPLDCSMGLLFTNDDLLVAWNAATEAAQLRWIPVGERLPYREGSYPVKINNKLSSFQKGYFDESKGLFDRVYFSKEYCDVTHWLELPELP